MGIPDHFTCLLRNPFAGQEATVRTGHGTTDWLKIEKGVCQDCTSSPYYLSYMLRTSCEILGWMRHKLESRLPEEISTTSDTQMIPLLIVESEEALLMKVKKESEKAGLKLDIQKTKIMAFSLITSWQIDGENVETVSDFISLGSKINVDSDCNHKIKRHLLLGRIALTNLDSVLKSRDVTLPTMVCLVRAMVFPLVMYGCACVGP